MTKIRLYPLNYRFNTDLTILLQNGKIMGKFTWIWGNNTLHRQSARLNFTRIKLGLKQSVLFHFKLTLWKRQLGAFLLRMVIS